jgi:hypothetical protein
MQAVIDGLKAVLHRLVDSRPMSEIEQTAAHLAIGELDKLVEVLDKVATPATTSAPGSATTSAPGSAPGSAPFAPFPSAPIAEGKEPAPDVPQA